MSGLQHEGAGAVECIGATDQVVAGNDAGDVACIVVLADERETGALWAAAGGRQPPPQRDRRVDVVAGLDPRRLDQRQAGNEIGVGVDGIDILASRDDHRHRIVCMQRHGQVGQRHPERADVIVVERVAADILRRRGEEIGHCETQPEVDGAGSNEADGPGVASGLGRIRHQAGVSKVARARFVDGNIAAECCQIQSGGKQ